MRVIDARSGKDMKIGDTVQWGGGEHLTLLDVDESLFSATAVVRETVKDYSKMGNPFVTLQRQIPLAVRFMHPSFLFQKVAFIPS